MNPSEYLTKKQTMGEVAIVSNLSQAEFNQKYYNKKPVIIKGAVLKSGSFKGWTDSYLKNTIGSRSVNVKHSQGGVYNITNNQQYENITLPFDEAVDLVAKPVEGGLSYYMQQLSIPEILPELLPDLMVPDLNSSLDNVSLINFWMGSAGCVTHLHYDTSQNFLVQVRGRKELLLFAPADSQYLYANEDEKFKHVSRVLIDKVDSEQFPLFENASPYRCLLEEGDVLYLTPFWWHHVRSLDTSISVNYWWDRFDIEPGLGLETINVERLCHFLDSFINKGFDINQKDEHGEPLLIKAIQMGFANVLEALLISGADPNAKSEVYMPGKSAYEISVETGQIEMAELLEKFNVSLVY